MAWRLSHDTVRGVRGESCAGAMLRHARSSAALYSYIHFCTSFFALFLRVGWPLLLHSCTHSLTTTTKEPLLGCIQGKIYVTINSDVHN